MTKLALLLTVSTALASGQTAPVPTSVETARKASIEGIVLNEVTKEPLRRVELRLYQPAKIGGNDFAYSAVTDAAGKFRIENIEPGEYYLDHRKTGFVGSRNSFGFSTRALKLGAGEALAGLRYSLLPQAIVTGHVVDDEGEPVQGVRVMLLRFRYVGGSKRAMQAGQAQTNDRGEYRIINVQPGKYYVQANVQRQGMDDGSASPATAAGAPRTVFVSTYYSSAADIAQAARIEVQAGLELTGQDIALRKERVVRVSGKVLEADGSPARRALVMFGRTDGFMGGFSTAGAPADENGKFTANSIRPGQYTVIASRMDGQNAQSAMALVNVGDVDVANLVLQILPGIEVNGSIALEGSGRKDFDFSGFNVSMIPAGSSPFGGAGTQAKADGTFTLSPVGPGHCNLNVHTGSTGGYVKSIQVGGEDVYGTEVDASSVAAAGIHVVVRLDPASVKGSVEIPEDRKAALRSPGALFVPADPRLRKAALVSLGQIDGNGGFELKNVRPGDYLAFAFEEYDAGSLGDPEVLAAIESKATKVTLSPGESKTLALKLLPWPQELADRLQ